MSDRGDVFECSPYLDAISAQKNNTRRRSTLNGNKCPTLLSFVRPTPTQAHQRSVQAAAYFCRTIYMPTTPTRLTRCNMMKRTTAMDSSSPATMLARAPW